MIWDNKMLLICLILGIDLVFPANCSSSEKDTRIFGGYTINIENAPYQVSIRLKNSDKPFGYGHICGGSVITSRVVLTAAHCIAISLDLPMEYRKPSEFTVVMGDTYLTRKTLSTVQFNVQEIIVHSNFNTDKTLNNDLALMFISGSVPTNSLSIRTISLNTIPLKNSTYCQISGWGKISANQVPDSLNQAIVPIVDQKICEISYNYLPQSMMCAGYFQFGGIDACQGDSGGPLFVIINWQESFLGEMDVPFQCIQEYIQMFRITLAGLKNRIPHLITPIILMVQEH